MCKKGTNKNDLTIGMLVEVNPQNDRTRDKRETGYIAEILSRTETHTHGMLVKLDNGIIGRVKSIIMDDTDNEVTLKSDVIILTKEQKSTELKIRDGENHFIEFKSSILWSERLTPKDIEKSSSKDVRQYGRQASKIIIAKTIAGFLNADGGDLIIGVKENKDTREDEMIGIESEYGKLKDPCSDGYRRRIIDSIIKTYFPKYIFNHFNTYLRIEFIDYSEKVICRINISKSDQRVFLKINNNDCFFIRIDASTRQLIGEEIVDYCVKRFK